ncbi:MAG: acyl-CoA dehydrogenase C-terminal domain-containing protein [Thalassotalea sp.]
MADYQVPLKDMDFLLYEVFNVTKIWPTLPNLAEHVDRETTDAILQECAKLVEQEIAPISRQGDEVGVSFNNGEVTTPPGFKAAFQHYVEGGWPALGGDVNYGGMGMPKMVTAFHEEMLCGADISFSLYPGLTAGAALSIAKHGSEALKARYLTRLYAGEWTGSMCLTEAHAGTDLGLIKTKAIEQSDGSYEITGSKMFITAGEHDLAENIIHLVLAKLPDAPAGSRGISMFLVPKINVNQDGSLAEKNNVTCGSIEHKMGIHASSTCVMNFDQAKGYLIGEVNKGLAAMFTMMNFERVGVGIQGIGAASRSYQNALEYAKDRQQSRSLTGVKSPNETADSIMVHGDVRRMLLNMKALTEGSRALSSYIALQLDIATYGEGQTQERAQSLVALMTPLAKAFFTDLAFESTVAGQQVFGGHGYIREWGQEQLVRDCRIAQIYEGTNGIQAMDLIARKVFSSKGQLMSVFIEEVSTYIEKERAAENLTEISPLITLLTSALQLLTKTTEQLITQAEQDVDVLGTAANDYLHLFGYVAMAYIWARMAETALQQPQAKDDFYAAKIKTAHYYFTKLLPRIHSLAATSLIDSKVLFDFEQKQF